MQVTYKIAKEVNEVIKRLNNLRRWTWFLTEGRSNELAKQALNCISAFMLTTICVNKGCKIRFERFPRIAIYRSFQKAYAVVDTPEYVLKDIFSFSKELSMENLDDVAREINTEKTNKEFSNFLCETDGTLESRLYKAASKIATYVELVENKIGGDKFMVKQKEILETLGEYYDIPGVKEMSDISGNYFKILTQISSLRNQNRWTLYSYRTDCSVLGHLFDTAVWAYLMSLEQNPHDEATATKMFFMGIFHDVPEAWTKDIPSPIKDRIPGFRELTEQYELFVMDKYIYQQVPEFMAEKIKEVMMEDERNASFKALLKGADYMSANSECWRQYLSGSRDPYFLKAIKYNNNKNKIKEGSVIYTPICKKMEKYFFSYSKKCLVRTRILLFKF